MSRGFVLGSEGGVGSFEEEMLKGIS